MSTAKDLSLHELFTVVEAMARQHRMFTPREARDFAAVELEKLRNVPPERRMEVERIWGPPTDEDD